MVRPCKSEDIIIRHNLKKRHHVSGNRIGALPDTKVSQKQSKPIGAHLASDARVLTQTKFVRVRRAQFDTSFATISNSRHYTTQQALMP